MLGDKDIGECYKCKAEFLPKDLKYSEVTDFYIKFFFPQINDIIENAKVELNRFMLNQSKNPENNVRTTLYCELQPFGGDIRKRLPKLMKNNNYMINITSGNDNVVSTIKKIILQSLNLPLKESEIEIRVKGTEISTFETYDMLKSLISSSRSETFYYCKK